MWPVGALWLAVLAVAAVAGLTDYEYLYDELPRPHLKRAVHVQHVPAAAPLAGPTSSPSVVQRVPRAAAEAGASAVAGLAGAGREDAAAEEAALPTAETLAGAGAGVSGDMETAAFGWGLGPVYPHLYVYRRVPHLVPVRGWNPYHSELLVPLPPHH